MGEALEFAICDCCVFHYNCIYLFLDTDSGMRQVTKYQEQKLAFCIISVIKHKYKQFVFHDVTKNKLILQKQKLINQHKS